jgi:hypothetical protein
VQTRRLPRTKPRIATLLAGAGSGGVISAGREHSARISRSALGPERASSLAVLLIRYLARPQREARILRVSEKSTH